MTPYEKVNLQTFLLCSFRAAGATGVSESGIRLQLINEGYTEISEPEISRELRELADKSWIISFTPPLGQKRWRVTALGTSVANESGY